MAAGADLFELLGPPSDEQARRIVMLLRLTPSQLAEKRRAQQDQKPAEAEPAA